jgi:hypothetical protein
MYKKGFYFELHDLLLQFVAAMDDVVISRFNKNREEQQQIKVRYVNAPVERVMNDIVNKSQNVTLPVIAVSISSLARDESRVFNKIEGFYNPIIRSGGPDSSSVRTPMPVPVNLGVNLSILTNYQTDMDQILSNFIPYSNPYIIISWKVPEEFGLPDITEIRSEVLWSGTINPEYPIELESNAKPRFVATTEFTIKGWIFPAVDTDFSKNIYFINSNFHTTNKINLSYDSYVALSADSTSVDVISISAAPLLTNIYHIKDYNSYPVQLLSSCTVQDKGKRGINFNILGQMLQYTTNILISSNTPNIYENLTSFGFTYYPTVSGYLVPPSYYTVMGENLIHMKLPPLTGEGRINLVVVNPVGWKDTNSINTWITYLSS